MAKFYGSIGFASNTEIEPGIWVENITDKKYYGDLLRYNSRSQSSDKINDDIVMSNEISIISDPFAYGNFNAIRYVEFMGIKWKVTNITIQYPRLILTIGGVYNGS